METALGQPRLHVRIQEYIQTDLIRWLVVHIQRAIHLHQLCTRHEARKSNLQPCPLQYSGWTSYSKHCQVI
jgi:hypothetical protein